MTDFRFIIKDQGNGNFKIMEIAEDEATASGVIEKLEAVNVSGVYSQFPASGSINAEGDVINVVNNNIGGIASGVASLLRFDLPLNADDDGVNHTTVHNIPVAEYDDLQDSFWNLKTPVGGISGIEFDFSWFSELTDTGEVSFNLSVRQLPSGVDVSTVTPITSVISETRTFTTDILNLNSAKLNVNIPGLQDISVSLTRNSDALNGKVRVVSYGIIYKASGVV